VAIVTT